MENFEGVLNLLDKRLKGKCQKKGGEMGMISSVCSIHFFGFFPPSPLRRFYKYPSPLTAPKKTRLANANYCIYGKKGKKKEKKKRGGGEGFLEICGEF